MSSALEQTPGFCLDFIVVEFMLVLSQFYVCSDLGHVSYLMFFLETDFFLVTNPVYFMPAVAQSSLFFFLQAHLSEKYLMVIASRCSVIGTMMNPFVAGWRSFLQILGETRQQPLQERNVISKCRV